MSNEKERARQLIDALIRKNYFSKTELSEKLGYASSKNIGEVYAGRANFNKPAKKALTEVFNVDIEWLELGIGEMFLDGSSDIKQKFSVHDIGHKNSKIVPIIIDANDREYITYVPLPAQAGFARSYPEDKGFMERLPHFNIPGYHNGSALAFPVEGVSMAPTLHPGDIVICEPVERLEWIEAKDIHVIVSDRGRQTKRLIYHKHDNDEESFIECISDNSYYNTEIGLSQRKIPISEVRSVFKVVMVISGNLPVPDETLKLIKQILAEIKLLGRRDISLQ